jgi:hypothetical protein
MDAKMRNLMLVTLACVCMLALVPSAALAWWGDKDMTPSSTGGAAWATATDCGTYWWVLGRLADCTTRGQTKTFNCGFAWTGRGSIHLDYVGCASKSSTNNRLNYRNQAGALTGTYNMFDGCTHSCGWYSILDTTTADLYNYNGIQVNADQSATSTCGSNCGVASTATREIHMWGDKYVYLNNWTCLGGYSSADVTQTTGRSFPWGEAGLYLYPAIETGYGNVINSQLGFGGKPVGAVATGDCGAAVANSLNFKGNASAYGNGDNMDSYGMAWVHCSVAAAPQFKFGSDDGNRVWVDGTLKFTDNTAHGMSYDAFTIASTGLAIGWHRILFKIHNGTSGFEGTMSLRNGIDPDQNEPNVDLQTDRTLGSSVSGEQDSWYPTIDVAAFEGATNPQPAAAVYTNDTTINANGTAGISSGCPVPFWKVMQFQWGYGISGNTNFADVSSSGTTWSHAQASVTGHRRFHFFAVSRSGRTSYQNNGDTGGWNFADGGPANYMDVYVDNVAPAAPSFSGVTVASPNQVNLAWSLPLDQGVNISNSATEATAGITSGGANGYVRGDVGVNVRRDSGSIYGWGAGTSVNDTGLTSNTQYTYDIAARDNTGSGRGAWQNATSYVGTTSVYTLAVAPTTGTNISAPATGSYRPATWPGVTNPQGFGTGGKVSKFMYKWSTSSSDAITEGQGTDWSSGTLTDLPSTDGTFYLYVRSYNAATVGNGSTKFGPYDIAHDTTAPTINSVTSAAATNTSPIAVSYSTTDTESGVKQITLWAKKGSSGTWASTSQTSTSASGSFNYTVSSEDTYYFGIVAEDNSSNKTADPSGAGSTHTVYDTTNPTADVTLTPESQGAVNYLKGKVTVAVTAADTSGSGIQKVEMKVDSGSYAEIIPTEGAYTDGSTTITSAWANGAHSITVKVTDNAGNYIEVESDFNVNRNEISGLIALQGFTLGSVSRSVTFVLTYTQSGTDHTITKTVTPTFFTGRASYSFTDVPDGIQAISAKTAWTLRRKANGITPDNGQATVDFTATLELPGGDLPTSGFPNGDNVVNALDYAVLRNSWGHFSGGDITGDGWTDNADYVTMKANWYKRGDPE